MIAKNIKKFREQKNISQSELAEKINVTRQAVSNLRHSFCGRCQSPLLMSRRWGLYMRLNFFKFIF